MTDSSEEKFEDELSDFDRQVAEAEAALDAMPAPNPASTRQVIIATRTNIKRRIATHGAEAVWKCYVALGYKVAFSTFRDYVYHGRPSRDAKGAEAARKTRRSRKGAAATTEAAVEQPLLTESSAKGGPVRARKMT